QAIEGGPDGGRHVVEYFEELLVGHETTRPFATLIPSAFSRRACSTSCPGTSRPVLVTTRHQGRPSECSDMTRPTARAAPGVPTSAATSPYDTTSPFRSLATTRRTRSTKSSGGTPRS